MARAGSPAPWPERILEIAYFTCALKAPSLAGAVERPAERARAETPPASGGTI